jgi:cell division protein FtsQ
MKKSLKVLIPFSTVAVIFLLLGFVNYQQSEMICLNTDIKILGKPELLFIERDDIQNKINSITGIPIGKKMDEINQLEIELEVEKLPCVKNAEVYKTIDGVLKLEVEQREPIARIINSNGNGYYIDKDGQTMPLSNKYSAKVVVFTGEIIEPYFKIALKENNLPDTLLQKLIVDDIFILSDFITQNDFLKAQVQQVYVNKNREFEITPRIGNNNILLGSSENLADKFNNLMLFYAQIAESGEWNKYNKINLKYKDQIVCTKK